MIRHYTEMYIKATILYYILLTDWQRLRTDPLRHRLLVKIQISISSLGDIFVVFI